MKRIYIVYSLRLVSFLSLFCISLRLLLDYEFSDPVLISFPLFFVGLLENGLLFPIPLFPYVIDEKEIASLIYPILVNIIFWIPIRKVYHTIYMVVWVEKWKSFFLMISTGLTFFLVGIYGSRESMRYFLGFSISTFYYIYLRYVLIKLRNRGLMENEKMDEVEKKIDNKKILVALIIHIIAFFSLSLEYQDRMKSGDIRRPVQKVEIPEADICDISKDGNWILYLRHQKEMSSKNNKIFEIGIRSFREEKIWIPKTMKDIRFLKFSKENDYIFVSGLNDDIGGEKLGIYDVVEGNMIKSFNFLERKIPLIKKIEFNEDSSFFLEIGMFPTIWEYETGKKIITYKDEDEEGAYSLAWLDNDEYIFLQRYKYPNKGFSKYAAEIVWNRILPNGDIEKKEKKKISLHMKDKIDKVGIGNMFAKNIDGKSICTIIGGQGKNGLLNYESYIDFWDITTERKLFSLNTGNEILDVVFFTDKNRFLVIERMKNKLIRVSFWNLEKKKKEENIFLQGIDENRKKEDIKVIKSGEEIVILWGFAEIWKID